MPKRLINVMILMMVVVVSHNYSSQIGLLVNGKLSNI